MLVLGWALAGLALVVTALGLALPRAALGRWQRWRASRWRSASAAGVAAWLAGFGSEALWPWLAGITLRRRRCCWRRSPGATLYLDTSQNLLGMEGFVVEVAEVCSGAEGIGLLLVLATAYLVRFRPQLRFPQALVVLPLGCWRRSWPTCCASPCWWSSARAFRKTWRWAGSIPRRVGCSTARSPSRCWPGCAGRS